MSANAGRSYAEILADLEARLSGFASPSDRANLIEVLAGLSFDIERIRRRQRAHAAALRFQGAAMDPELQGLVERLPVEATIDARDPLDAVDGFYPLEYDETAAYRWTGPGSDFLFRLWLDRSKPLVFEAAVLSFGDPRNRAELRLFVDGKDVGVVCTEGVIRSNALPTRDESAPTEFRVSVPFAFRPSDDGADDSRSLRLAFTRVRVFPASAGAVRA